MADRSIILIGPDNWKCSQLSIAAHYGGIRINGHEYFIDERSQYLVRKDWVGVVRAAGIDRTKLLIRQGYTTASSAMAVLRREKAKAMEKRKDQEKRQTKLF